MGIRQSESKSSRKMSDKPYSAFFQVGKDENLVESKMPKALEEYFPKKKTVKILVRQHDRKHKLRKMQRKVGQLQSKLMKPKYSLRDPTKLRTSISRRSPDKRKSTDKVENDETKRSRSSVDFDEVANVETTKAADVPMTSNAQNQTA